MSPKSRPAKKGIKTEAEPRRPRCSVRKADPPKRGLRPGNVAGLDPSAVRKADPPKRGLRLVLSVNQTHIKSEKQTRQKGD